MDVGIVGSGMIGANVARLAVDAGHGVVVANRRGPDSLRELIADLGEGAAAGVVAEAAAAELTVVAIPLGAYADLDPRAFEGSTVVDTANYYPRRDGHIAELDDDQTTSTQLVASRWLPGATVVKAFNTIWFKELTARADRELEWGQRLAVPVAADDDDALQRVLRFVDSLGLAGVDAGGLADTRRLQPGAAVYTATLTPAQLRAALASA
jgi:predicted dinucleotide-binding enzyme